MAKRIRVVTSNGSATPPKALKKRVVVANESQTVVSSKLTDKELQVRKNIKYATTTAFRNRSADTMDSGMSSFYSPQLSTDFLEKPQNLRERRAFYRFFYNTNEIVGQAIDIHSSLPLSKLRLIAPKGKNPHQNKYVMKFFEGMCENMKLFRTLIDITHDYLLFGNCVRKDAGLRVESGYIPAEQVQVGDKILTDKGRYRAVLKKCHRIVRDILEIKCWKDFRVLPVTEEHPIEVFREGTFVFEQAGNISLQDYIRVTWPSDVIDVDEFSLVFSDCYEKTEGGYNLFFKVPHSRNPLAIEARKKILGWVGSLTNPVIKTRDELCRDLDISKYTFNSVLTSLDNELDQINIRLHKRIGAKGWQKGSQTVWEPIDTKNIEVTDSYVINKILFLNAIDSVKIDPDFAYLVGFWMGDGTLSRDNNRDTWGRGLWQIAFEKSCVGNINRVRKILEKMFGMGSVTEWQSSNMVYLRIISNPAFVEWWADNFGETSFGKNHKRIPEWFVKLPTEKLQQFVAGLIDADGCISCSGELRHTIVNISMCSQDIMDIVRDIVLKIGAVVNYTHEGPHEVILPNGSKMMSKDLYTLTASDEESCQLLSEYSNKNIPEEAHFTKMGRYWIRTDEGLAFKIRDISTKEYGDKVYNFEVEEDHTYQVAGFSTHNCFIFAEESDDSDNMTPEERAKEKEESSQRSEFLKNKYEVVDKNPCFKGWKKLIILPPDQVRVRKLPLSDEVAIEYVPDPQTKEFIVQGGYSNQDPDGKEKRYSMPKDLQDKVRMSGVIPLDTDPNTGSYVFHLARKKSQYEPLGVSMIERCINTLVLLDKLRQAQTSIASRHMTPMRVVWAEDLNPEQVDDLREQVDMALVDPDYSIIANYEVHWEEMGSNGRLLDIEAENEAGLNRLLAGLGMTREILTGEGSYTGSKISLEIMNTQYLLYREVLQDYVENYLFKPIARKKGFIEYDEYGNEILLYPKLSFTRLAIRDNDHFFDAVFQLYQKGSVSIDLILDILNIDPISTREKIEQDLFTVNDSLFNELMRNIYTNVSAPLVEQTNLMDKMTQYLHLEKLEEAPAEEPGMKRFSGDKPVTAGSKDQVIKMAKIMKYLKDNPALLDKVFSKCT